MQNISVRNNRLRGLIKKLNKERKKQNQKIDILCNDLIGAQRGFLQRLSSISFSTYFYESILGSTELENLFEKATEKIQEEIPETSLIFCLRSCENYKLYRFDYNEVTHSQPKILENSFNPELIENICLSNKVCTIEDMFSLGLQGNLRELDKISAFTIPLSISGLSCGFIFIWRSSAGLTQREISKMSSITAGLSKAIQSCRLLSHSAN